MGRFGLARLAAARFGSCRFGRCFGGGAGATFDFQLSATVSSGVSATNRGYRVSSYGSMTPTVWEDNAVSRLLITGSAVSASATVRLSGQFKTYTTLWLKVGDADFLDLTWDGTTQYFRATPAAAAAWAIFNANVGVPVPVLIEARS